jgi:hypothetical protein
MLKGKTRSGFEFEIKDNALDMRVIKAIRKAKEDISYIDEVFERLLGEEQQNALYDHLEKLYGSSVPDRAAEELIDIFNSFENGKNS